MFPLDINDYEKIGDRFQMQVNVFGYENRIYPVYISKKSYNQKLKLLLITEEDKKHNCMSYFQSFTTEEILSSHEKQCFLINGAKQ